MPNPHSPGYPAHTEHGRLHLSAPHLSSLPQPFRPHTFTVQCLPALPVTSPSLGTWSPPALVWSQLLTPGEVPGQGGSGVAPGWQSSGCLCSPATPRWKLNKSRAWAALYLPPSSQRPDTLWSCGIGADRGGIPSATCSTMGLLTND